MRRPFLFLIRLYQALVSPMLGVACRYEPSCSAYAYEAVERYGVARGAWMALRRLSRCRPGGGSGYDPVPDRPAAEARSAHEAHAHEARAGEVSTR
jgi:uncharacterized protein